MVSEAPPFMEWPFAEEVYDTPELPENLKKRKSSDFPELSSLGHPGWTSDAFLGDGSEQTEQAYQLKKRALAQAPSLTATRISEYYVFSPSKTTPAYSLWSLSSLSLLSCNDEFATITETPLSSLSNSFLWTNFFPTNLAAYGNAVTRTDVRYKIQASLMRLKLANEILVKGRLNFIQHRLSLVTYSGRVKDVHLSVVVLHDRTGQPVEGATFLTDITNAPDRTLFPETPLEAEAAPAPPPQQPPAARLPPQQPQVPTPPPRQLPPSLPTSALASYPLIQPPRGPPRNVELTQVTPPEQTSRKPNAKPWETNTATFKWRKVNRWSNFSNADYPS
jgi:hypothetical protein